MNTILLEYFNKALDMEEAGYPEQALVLMEKLINTFPDYEEELYLEKAKMKFRNGNDKEALMEFIGLYERYGKKEIYDLIMEGYYIPNKEGLNTTFQNNMELLKAYPHYRNCDAEETVQFLPVWQDEEHIVCVNLKEKTFAVSDRKKKDFQPLNNVVVILINELWMEEILKCEENHRIERPFMDMNVPLYLVFDRIYWELVLQLYNLKELIEKERMVFLVGRNSLKCYLREEMVLLPKRMYINNESDYEEFQIIIGDIASEIERKTIENIDKAKKYYDAQSDVWIKNNNCKVKILFITCRFTTVLQYHIRDSMEAARRLGCETKLLIEPDGIHRISEAYMLSCITDFQPDIIFCIDHFRYEYSNIPDKVVWVTWIQDHLPYILDRETPLKLKERDFVMNHFITWDRIKSIGYPDSRTMDAPVVANETVYKPYNLTEEEENRYGADICMVCHASDAEDYIEELLCALNNTADDEVRAIVKQLLYDYCNLVRKEEIIFYTKEEMYNFINEYTKKFYNLILNEQFVSFLAENTYIDLNQRVYRQAIADWLIEAGYKNIKLWGNGWLKNPKYQPYAMGAAENGEVLSKILQSTKIVLGNNFNVTGAARAWESMLSGTFYMSNYVPIEIDAVDIRKIMVENENLIFFYNKHDLINKVGYYLIHEEERKQIAQKGRQVALENQTFGAVMDKMLKFVRNSIEKEK